MESILESCKESFHNVSCLVVIVLVSCFIMSCFVVSVWNAIFDVSIIALAGAAVLLLISKVQPAKAFTHVEWPTLLFFAGLFVIVSGVELTGCSRNLC